MNTNPQALASRPPLFKLVDDDDFVHGSMFVWWHHAALSAAEVLALATLLLPLLFCFGAPILR